MTSRRERPPSGRHNMSGRYSALPSPLSNNDSVAGSYRERPKSAFPPSHQQQSQAQKPYYMSSPRKEQNTRPSTAGGNNQHSNNNNNNGYSNSGVDMRASMPNLPVRRPQTANPASVTSNNSQPRNNNNNHNNNAVPSSSSNPNKEKPQVTERSNAESEVSTNEVLRRMREKSDLARRKQASEEIDALGDYNAFSRPRPSNIAPLRSAFLDPETNNFPRSRTRSELMKRIRYASMPHPSYDLDNDGYVSRDDYKLAKRFDFDGNGLLDPEEREIGKRVLTDEFFKRHAQDLHNFGQEFVNRPHKENVQKVCTSAHFEHTFGKLMSMERTLKAESSKPLLDCIRNDDDPDFQKHKYYVDKFDTTAWNDFTRLPRSSWMTLRPQSSSGRDTLQQRPVSPSANAPFANAFNTTGFGPTLMVTMSGGEHCGSRKRLLFTRQQQLRAESDVRLRSALSPPMNNRRVNLITDIAKENS